MKEDKYPPASHATEMPPHAVGCAALAPHQHCHNNPESKLCALHTLYASCAHLLMESSCDSGRNQAEALREALPLKPLTQDVRMIMSTSDA